MKPAPPPQIGTNIQRIRKEQELTLEALAERSGVSKAMLSQIESDKVNPTVLTIYKIARGLEVELDAILKMLLGKDSSPPEPVEEDKEVTTPIVSIGPSGIGGDYQVEW